MRTNLAMLHLTQVLINRPITASLFILSVRFVIAYLSMFMIMIMVKAQRDTDINLSNLKNWLQSH